MNAQVAPADGRALPVLSPAVAAAQERLGELRRLHGVTSHGRPPSPSACTALSGVGAGDSAGTSLSDDDGRKVRRTQESATHRERWAEIARRGLFSQPLVEHLRRVTGNQRQATSEGGADPLPNPLPQGEGDGPLPNPLPQGEGARPSPQPSPTGRGGRTLSSTPLPACPPTQVKVYPDIALAILRRKKAAAGRV